MRRRVFLPHAPEGFELLVRYRFPHVIPGPARGHHYKGRQFVEVWGLCSPLASPGEVAFMLACWATTRAAAIISVIGTRQFRNSSSVKPSGLTMPKYTMRPRFSNDCSSRRF